MLWECLPKCVFGGRISIGIKVFLCPHDESKPDQQNRAVIYAFHSSTFHSSTAKIIITAQYNEFYLSVTVRGHPDSVRAFVQAEGGTTRVDYCERICSTVYAGEKYVAI